MWGKDQLGMLGPARRRWVTLSHDNRVLLAIALSDAVAKPYRVGNYRLTFYRLGSGELVSIHEFRFGFVTFILCETDDCLYVYDFDIDEDIFLAAE